MRVLLIEDDSATAQSIELIVQSEGFNVYTTISVKRASTRQASTTTTHIVLDLNLPDMSGYEVLKTLRVSKVQTPILILSGLAGIEDRSRARLRRRRLMTKPFHKDELVARIHAFVRRSKGHAQSVIETGGSRSTSTPRRWRSTISACIDQQGIPDCWSCSRCARARR